MRTIQIILLILIIIGVGLIFSRKYWVDDVVNFILKQEQSSAVKSGPLDAAYTIEGRQVRLTKTEYFGNEAEADLNGDALLDTAFIITQQPGGSGTFYYLVVALQNRDGYLGTNAIFLGDRIAPQTTEIRESKIIVNYATRNPTEPITTAPSVGVSKYFLISDGKLIEK